MTTVRRILGHFLLFLSFLLSTLCVGIVKAGAWLLDREEYSRQLSQFIKERDEEHPLPKFDDLED
jgi:hypothetical protein